MGALYNFQAAGSVLRFLRRCDRRGRLRANRLSPSAMPIWGCEVVGRERAVYGAQASSAVSCAIWSSSA